MIGLIYSYSNPNGAWKNDFLAFSWFSHSPKVELTGVGCYRGQAGVCVLANLRPKSQDTPMITRRRGFRRAHSYPH